MLHELFVPQDNAHITLEGMLFLISFSGAASQTTAGMSTA